MYEDKKLVSLISMFIPTRQEAEISAYTLPDYRQKGYFSRLLTEAVKEIKKFNISSLIFVCEPQSSDGKKTISKLMAELECTEYFLRYKGSSETETQQVPRINLHPAEQKELEAIIILSQEIFHDVYEDAKSMIIKTFEADNRIQYIATLDNKPIGMSSVSFENDEASIFGLGVSPQYQGKGFGGEILKLLLKDMKERGIENITIEVDSNNINAFNLYRKSGFEVAASFEYYRKNIRTIKA